MLEATDRTIPASAWFANPLKADLLWVADREFEARFACGGGSVQRLPTWGAYTFTDHFFHA